MHYVLLHLCAAINFLRPDFVLYFYFVDYIQLSFAIVIVIAATYLLFFSSVHRAHYIIIVCCCFFCSNRWNDTQRNNTHTDGVMQKTQSTSSKKTKEK